MEIPKDLPTAWDIVDDFCNHWHDGKTRIITPHTDNSAKETKEFLNGLYEIVGVENPYKDEPFTAKSSPHKPNLEEIYQNTS